jgi:glyoxylase-like metal-dependent hydrolase (beta-lactamase superfamily II)
VKVINLTKNSRVYTSNVYFLGGTHNAISDVNTLIDVGRDESIFGLLAETSTGFGKKPIEHVILTHGHYDHMTLLTEVRRRFNPIIYAYSPAEGVDRILRGGETLKVADSRCEIIHMTAHSYDSLCIYFPDAGLLFSGDTPLMIRSGGGSYPDEFVEQLEDLAGRNIRMIYPGHGDPIPVCDGNVFQDTLKAINITRPNSTRRQQCEKSPNNRGWAYGHGSESF